jgi:hypothetical protein
MAWTSMAMALQPGELAPLTKENIASLKDYEYFTVMRANGEQQKSAR